MTSVTIEQLGYMSNSQVQQKICSIQSLNARGLYVYPCHRVTPFGCGCGKAHKDKKEWGKHPSNGASHLIATNDPQVTGQFWSLAPECNVGINPKKSKKVVIDIDPRSAGHISWVKILDELGIENPVTWSTLTGLYDLPDGTSTRGTHLWFEMPFDYAFPANLDELGFTGIDIKYNGGVLAPPSIHGSGVTYEWASGRSPDDVKIGCLPESLLRLILSAAKPKVIRDVIGYRLPPENADAYVAKLLDVDLVDGTRNVSFYKLACKVAYWLGCHSESQVAKVKAVLSDFNLAHVHPPLDETDNYEEQVNRAIAYVQSGGSR